MTIENTIAFIATKMANVDNLNEKDLKNISNTEKTKACELLAARLGLMPYDHDKDMVTDIYVDYVYDHLMFAVEKGCSWKNVLFVVKLAENMLKYSKEKHIAEVINWYRWEAENLVNRTGERFFKMYTEFVFSTFFSHYSIYQYVFTHDRDEHIPTLALDVIPPKSPEPFREGKEFHIFEYEQKLSEIEKRETERMNDLTDKKEKLMNGQVLKDELYEQIKDSEEPLTKETLSDMVTDILSCYTSMVGESLKNVIEETQEHLVFKIEKTSLPRPQALGPPPRYKTKSPVSSKGLPKTPENKTKPSRENSTVKSK